MLFGNSAWSHSVRFWASHLSWLLLLTRNTKQHFSYIKILFVQGTEVLFYHITFPTSTLSWSRELWAISCCHIQLAILWVVSRNTQEQRLVYWVVSVDLGWPDQCDLILISRRKHLQWVAKLINAGSHTERTSSNLRLAFTTFGLPKHSNNSACADTCDNQVTCSHLLHTVYHGSVYIYYLCTACGSQETPNL